MATPRPDQTLREAVHLHQAGQLAQAEVRYAQLRRQTPYSFDVHHLSGWLALQQGRAADAVGHLQRAAKLNSRSALCQLRLAHALRQIGRLSDARVAAQQAATLEPGNADTHFLLGELAGALDGFRGAIAPFRRVVELQPGAADAWANLGVSLAQAGEPGEALTCFDRTLALDANNVQALSGRALVLQEAHQPAAAVQAYAEVLRRDPARHEARSARLLALHYLEQVPRTAMFAEHQAFGAAVGAAPAPFPPARERPPGPLRVAFLSPDLRAHSVAYFLEPLLAHLDRGAFEVMLYHDHAKVDAMSVRLQQHAMRWRNFAGHPDDAVEAVIRADAPEVLVDLAGHTGFNRLPLLARRLAPVQVTYLGYPDTTGVPAIDFRFVDAVTDPVGVAEAYATERLVRFAPTAWAYAPPADAPAIATRPAGGTAPVTFGCFNNFAKVTDGVMRCWAELLAAVPRARLCLKSQGLEGAAGGHALARLERAGIPRDRVTLLGRLPSLAAHLAAYADVDIALDTFPYHGTTTTCEALWMGVPVISICGEHHMSRVGASLLQALGRPEWIAPDAAGFVRIAAALAGDRERLARERGELRPAMQASPLLDHAGQARRFGEALLDCWQVRCAASG
jgi:predicted O-linked N-acetylglucosamine transferase (SPINDLY family)